MRKVQNIVTILLGIVILSLHNGKVKGQWLLQSQNYGHMTIGFDTSTEHFDASIMERGRRFIPRQPGLTGEGKTVSFESADYPGRFLRHYGYVLYTEHNTNPRNPDIFNEDATFIIHPNRYIRGYYVFESVNYRNYFLRHKDYTVRITNSSDNAQVFEADASFRFVQNGIMLQPRRQEVCVNTHCKIGGIIGSEAIMQDQGLYFSMVSPGLSGVPQSIGFELQNYPGYYLRDYAQYAFFDAANTSRSARTYVDDVNFALRFNKFAQGYYAIESMKYPGRYLRAVGLTIKFDPQDGSNNFAGDASFRLVNGPVYLESKNMPDHKMGLNEDNQALMTTQGYRFNLFYPGLTGAGGTVSFESYEKPGFYLRHYDYNMDLEDVTNPRNPGIFNEDATFFLRKDVWHNDYIVFESVNYKNHSIRHFDYRLKIGNYEDSEIFREDSSYKMIEGPHGIDSGGGQTSSSSNAGKITGGVIGGLLALLLIVVIIIYTNRKFAWMDTLKLKVQRGGSDRDGGVANPSYPEAGFSVNEDTARVTQESTSKSVSSTTSSPPHTPTTPADDPFDDQPKPNPVRRLSRRLSNSMSRLRRSMSGENNKEEDRHIEVPQAFGLNVQDFQPGTEGFGDVGAPEAKGSFGNPMYGLTQLTPTEEAEPQQKASLHRHDSLIDTSPTLFDDQQDSFKAMSFFDETLEMAEQKELAKEQGQEVDKPTKKKLSPGITPIGEDDLWDIGDA